MRQLSTSLALLLALLGCGGPAEAGFTSPVGMVAHATPTAPSITSLSASSGDVGDSITIFGARFIGTSAVAFNGTSAAFVVVDSTTVTTTVPSGATTGTISLTTPYGSAVSSSFTINACTFCFSLVEGTLPAGLTATRTGSTMYPATSATTAVAVPGAAVCENRGDDQGGGCWTWPTFTNYAAAGMFDFSTGAGWTYDNSPSFVANDAVAPDGTTTADLLGDVNAGSTADALWTTTGLGSTNYPLLATVYVKDVAGSVPTVPGALAPVVGGVAGSETLSTGLPWRRASATWYNTSLRSDAYIGVWPAGATPQSNGSLVLSPTATGAVHVWGAQATKGLADLPLAAGTAGNLTIAADTPANILDGSGNLHAEGAFLLDQKFNNGGNPWETGFTVARADTSNGQLRLDYNDQIFKAYFNGNNIVNGITFDVNVGVLSQPTEVRWELMNSPSLNKTVLQIWIGGERTTSIRSTSVTQSTPTTFYLGHSAGSSILPRRHTLLRKITRGLDAANGVVLGDSIVSKYLSYYSVGSRILSLSESRDVPIVSYATPGETAADQYTRWLGCAQRGASDVQWVLVHVGTNDAQDGDPAATIITRIQNIVTDVNTQNPSAQILLSPIFPMMYAPDGRGPAMWAVATAVNTAIAGGGGTPITGTNLTRIPYWSFADQGDGTMTVACANTDAGATGDWLHQNTSCRVIMASVYRAALVLLGLL